MIRLGRVRIDNYELLHKKPTFYRHKQNTLLYLNSMGKNIMQTSAMGYWKTIIFSRHCDSQGKGNILT